MLVCVRVSAVACVGVLVGVCCDCRLTDRRPRRACARAQGGLGAQRPSDSVDKRAVVR